jgi:hypothetical protein
MDILGLQELIYGSQGAVCLREWAKWPSSSTDLDYWWSSARDDATRPVDHDHDGTRLLGAAGPQFRQLAEWTDRPPARTVVQDE